MSEETKPPTAVQTEARLVFLGQFIKPRSLDYFRAEQYLDWEAFLEMPLEASIARACDAGYLELASIKGVVMKWKLTHAGALILAQHSSNPNVKRKARDLL